MSSAPSFSRRDFTRLAATGAGAAVLGCSPGILSAGHELSLTMSGTGRLLDTSGKVLGTETLAPVTASGLLGSPVIRAASITNGIGTLRIPTPGLIGFVRTPSRKRAVLTRVDRAADGSTVETTLESPGDGIPGRRIVRVPAHGAELTDVHDFQRLGELSVLAQRRIEVRQHGHLVADLTILATGEVRLATSPRFRPATLARVFLPRELHAQSDCGVDLLLHFLSATLGVMAALGTCASGPWCILGLIGALIQWAEVIGEMEACKQT
jgi:hypothetical protein